jgi:putative phosphoribosyl transferase
VRAEGELAGFERRHVTVDSAAARIVGDLTVPRDARGVVVFAHGSGSGRFSSRNQYVASELMRGGLATLLLDLLTGGEEAVDRTTAHLRFDIPLLAARVVAAIDWVAADDEIAALPVGCFGASTGAAAALVAAAERPEHVGAIVSRGGRPDLAGEALRRVTAPTLLIVGSRDPHVLHLNGQAQALLGGESRLEIVPGATHLFEEPGALEQVATLAAEWFVEYLIVQSAR